MRIAFAIALLIAAPSYADPVPTSKHIQKILAKGDGLTAATAYEVSSVRDEYLIAQALNLEVLSQSLVIQNKPYDMLEVKDQAGNVRELWFDISRFYRDF